MESDRTPEVLQHSSAHGHDVVVEAAQATEDLSELEQARLWAAWFAAEADDARQWSQHYEYEAELANRQIDAMIEEGVEAGLGLKSLTVEDGKMSLSVTTKGVAEATVLAMLDGMAEMLGDATNYVEFDLSRRGKEPVSVCVRRMYHPTPHQLREQAEHERDAALAKVAELQVRLAALSDGPTTV